MAPGGLGTFTGFFQFGLEVGHALHQAIDHRLLDAAHFGQFGAQVCVDGGGILEPVLGLVDLVEQLVVLRQCGIQFGMQLGAHVLFGNHRCPAGFAGCPLAGARAFGVQSVHQRLDLKRQLGQCAPAGVVAGGMHVVGPLQLIEGVAHHHLQVCGDVIELLGRVERRRLTALAGIEYAQQQIGRRHHEHQVAQEDKGVGNVEPVHDCMTKKAIRPSP